MTDAEHIERLRRVMNDPYYATPVPFSGSIAWALATIEAQRGTVSDEQWDNLAVHCGNCDVEIITRGGRSPKNNGLSDVGESEDEALCGLCAGEEMYSLMAEREKLESRIAELEAALKEIAHLPQQVKAGAEAANIAVACARKALGGNRD